MDYNFDGNIHELDESLDDAVINTSPENKCAHTWINQREWFIHEKNKIKWQCRNYECDKCFAIKQTKQRFS